MKAISLFSGAGGMDVGFKKAGFEVVWANDIDPVACETFKLNGLGDIVDGDLTLYLEELKRFSGIDIVFGGPPCQGFSVAGKMDPNDHRSSLVWRFFDVVKITRPRAFVMENVKALGTLSKWAGVRQELISSFRSIGYASQIFILKATDFGVPQKRERMFLIGLRDGDKLDDIGMFIQKQKKHAPTVREAIAHLGKPGEATNPLVCNAAITLAAKPVMRKSPFAGMIFNGMGRPIDIDGHANTLPASMGGNKTPIIDQRLLDDPSMPNWVVDYHSHLLKDGEPYFWKDVPNFLRRITVHEAAAIQSFPHDFKFSGKKSALYRLIGNAVPCELAFSVASSVASHLRHVSPYDIPLSDPYQLKMIA
jgi:DNA (cytosine-5)-methyltransferase 1